MIKKRHLTPPGWAPPFVVPSHLTQGINTRSNPSSNPPAPRQRRYGPVPQFTKEERRRRHLKVTLRQRHEHRIDESIAKLEERLEILKEIRDELTER